MIIQHGQKLYGYWASYLKRSVERNLVNVALDKAVTDDGLDACNADIGSRVVV